MEDLAYDSGTVNCNFLFTQTEPEWQNQSSFKDYIQRIDEELKDVASHIQRIDEELKDVARISVFIFLDNYPTHINVYLFKWCSSHL